MPLVIGLGYMLTSFIIDTGTLRPDAVRTDRSTDQVGIVSAATRLSNFKLVQVEVPFDKLGAIAIHSRYLFGYYYWPSLIISVMASLVFEMKAFC